MATPANLADAERRRASRSSGLGGGQRSVPRRARDADDASVQARAGGRRGQRCSPAGRDGAARRVGSAHRTIGRAVRELPDTNVAVISVPGAYAALEAHEALTAGLDVLLFSDNVSIPEEVALKDRAARLGRLLMGPGAGTAMLGGTGLGFANVVRAGPVGIVAAAGTGAQEAMSLLDRWGVGVSAVIGLGGRDLSDAVERPDGQGGDRGAPGRPAARELIFLVSKPPAERVASAVLSAADGFPLVAALVGRARDAGPVSGLRPARTLEAGALDVLDLLGVTRPDVVGDLPERVAEACRATGDRAHAGPRPVLRRDAVLRGAGDARRRARARLLQRPAGPRRCGCRRRRAVTSASISARRSTRSADLIR